MGSDTFKDSDLDDLVRDLNTSISTLENAFKGFDSALGDWIEICR